MADSIDLDLLPDHDSVQDVPDIMNDPTFEPPTRRNTASSKHGSDGFGGETCRICRSEGTPDEPLFYPCKCSGSIKFVHQECLMEWLSHSHKKHCELCKTPFRFTKLYDANMPSTLPWNVFLSRALLHTATSLIRAARMLLVAVVWLVILPFLVRWAWRWMFWFADAGWARQTYILKTRAAQQQFSVQLQQNTSTSVPETLYESFKNMLGTSSGTGAAEQQNSTLGVIASGLNLVLTNATPTTRSRPDVFFWPQTDASILSSWTYLSELTPSPHLNRQILDVFEGQLITCVVITGFILLFLIREWVVQQQPLVNLVDNLNNAQQARERLDQARRERAQRQLDLLEQARERLERLQDEINAGYSEQANASENNSQVPAFVGWEALSTMIDSATAHLRKALDDRYEKSYDMFALAAMDTLRQFRAAQRSDVDIAELSVKVFEKLSAMSNEERQAWEEILLAELKDITKHAAPAEGGSQPTADEMDLSDGSQSNRRPPMPQRDSSSRATQIQRLLEEADTAFTTQDRHGTGTASTASAIAEPPTETASVISAPSTESSWQQVSPPAELGDLQQDEASELVETSPGPTDNDIPITNAGPDAKFNIKRGKKPKIDAVKSAPKAQRNLLTNHQLKTLLAGSQRAPTEPPNAPSASDPIDPQPTASPRTDPLVDNPFHPEGAEPEPREQDTLRDRVEDVFREDLVFEQTTPQLQRQPASVANADGDEYQQMRGTDQPNTEAAQAVQVQPDLVQRLVDWFWGDIDVQNVPEPAIAPMEEIVAEGENLNQAQFAPDQQPDHPEEDPQQAELPHGNDPEVVAAAQQAGLDAEAIEDAEDLEGIFELIGLQGPLVGLFQTSCFCCVLVAATVAAAVGMPYVWGKLVLSFLGDPWTFCIKTPLQAASFVADFISDLSLVILGWLTVVIAITSDILCQFAFVEKWAPILTKNNVLPWVSEVASSTASSAAYRLAEAFASEPEPGEGLGWNWAFLTASAHAHSSLNTIKDETNAVLHHIGGAITHAADTISSGSTTVLWKQFVDLLKSTQDAPAWLRSSIATVLSYMATLRDLLESLKTGALTFQSSKFQLEPSLVYWNSTDRSLAVLAGYVALAALATVYVAVDKNITPYKASQKVEKMVRDTLRQAGGVFKVILIISIEMLVFPLYCGLLLDLAFLPLFQGASISSRWSFAIGAPYTFGFIHWFVGTCYMFHFALFVGMCRKILRKGVLWFIRDPDDPTFHPVRDVLERNVTTQLRKIAFSALVYGALVILCLGGVIWSIGKVFHGIFPIHWISTEPILEFPLDLALYNFLTPLVLRLSNPSTVVSSVYAWWLKRCAHWLRLSHFLFDDAREDEEGRHVRRSWKSYLLMSKGDPHYPVMPSDPRFDDKETLPEVYFKRDGKHVLTPCNDQYKPPKAGEAFLHTDNDDVYIADKDGKKNLHFAKVYIPPLFRLRMTMFMVCLWIFSAFAGLCATLVPLVFGRTIFSAVLPAGTRVNDIYSYSLGAYILAMVFYAALKGSSIAKYLQARLTGADIKARTADALKYGSRAAKCLYVYGLAYVVIPAFFAVVLQLYVVLPLHTYAVATLRPALASNVNTMANLTETASTLLQNPLGEHDQVLRLADHSIHMVADYALCLIYMRIALRWIVQSPTSRAAEAIRRITADGYLNPDARLATRFFILPALILVALLLIVPPALIKMATVWAQFLHNRVVDEAVQILLYRYSYPVVAGTVFIVLGSRALAKATGRWRARIRDEVYLVGERLHNFGEKKPPAGSKSVVRKDK